jgi:hypothetical protein
MTNTLLFNKNMEQKLKEEEILKEKNPLFNFKDKAIESVEQIYDPNIRICEYCLKKNSYTANICQYCYQKLPKSNNNYIKTPRQNEKYIINEKAKFWLCTCCKILNRVERNECECCKKDKNSNKNDIEEIQQVRKYDINKYIPNKAERSISPSKKLCIECRKPTSNNNTLCFACLKKKKVCKECSKPIYGNNTICDNCNHTLKPSDRSTSPKPKTVAKLPTFNQSTRKSKIIII